MLVVNTAATSTQLCSLAAVKDELCLTDTSADAYLSRAIDWASAAVLRYVNRVLAQETVTETIRLNRAGGGYFDAAWNVQGGTPRRLQQVVLTRYPVISIASVISGDDTLAAGTDYECDLELGELYRMINDARAWFNARKIVVQYTAGYKLPNDGTARTLPADVERAAILGVSAMYAARRRDPLLRSETVDQVGSSSWLDPQSGNGGLPMAATAMLEPYRRINIV